MHEPGAVQSSHPPTPLQSLGIGHQSHLRDLLRRHDSAASAPPRPRRRDPRPSSEATDHRRRSGRTRPGYAPAARRLSAGRAGCSRVSGGAPFVRAAVPRTPEPSRRVTAACGPYGRGMKILFVTDQRVNAGSIQALASYVRAGDALGHTIAVDGLQLVRVLSAVPRHRRAILDADGMYNPLVEVDGYDRNHASERERGQWIAYYEQLADTILQPTFMPLQPGVRSLLFYGYDPAAELGPGQPKRFDLLHVGHNWWRWRDVNASLLPALERIRPYLDGVGFVGLWWDAAPPWARQLGLEDAS